MSFFFFFARKRKNTVKNKVNPSFADQLFLFKEKKILAERPDCLIIVTFVSFVPWPFNCRYTKWTFKRTHKSL